MSVVTCADPVHGPSAGEVNRFVSGMQVFSFHCHTVVFHHLNVLCTLLQMLLLVRLSSQTYRRDYDARPENVSRGTENVQVMKDDSMTVIEDLHARNKAIHFTHDGP